MTKHNIIVIGTSAGGVDALCELNKHLPNDLDASVFVVMHIGTETLLPEILSRCGNLPAVVAEHGTRYRRACQLSFVDKGSHHSTDSRPARKWAPPRGRCSISECCSRSSLESRWGGL